MEPLSNGKGHRIKPFLDELVWKYNTSDFIADDPVQVPHRFKKKEDIEISGFLTATICFGQRMAIIRSALKMMEFLDDAPYEFVISSSPSDLKKLEKFVYRYFQSEDFIFVIQGLKKIYTTYGELESIFRANESSSNLYAGIEAIRNIILTEPHSKRCEKHIANPLQSACKRINLFLRWMIRKDHSGVDFGLWDISPSKLSCPLDVHSARSARTLGLLHRKSTDRKTVNELDQNLRMLDASDPVKYDYALFGMGVFKLKM